MADKIPVAGYKPGGLMQVFELDSEDDELPEGWSKKVPPGEHPEEIAELKRRAALGLPEQSPTPEPRHDEPRGRHR